MDSRAGKLYPSLELVLPTLQPTGRLASPDVAGNNVSPSIAIRAPICYKWREPFPSTALGAEKEGALTGQPGISPRAMIAGLCLAAVTAASPDSGSVRPGLIKQPISPTASAQAAPPHSPDASAPATPDPNAEASGNSRNNVPQRESPAEGNITGGIPACGPDAGDCFDSHDTPGCNDVACCNRVCDEDPECCQWMWDSFCVDEATDSCGCAGEGDCFAPNDTPSCTVESCCAAVCAEDAYCCDSQWDCACADAAARLCGHGTCPGDGSCFEANGTPGCEDELCCNLVCIVDPECCNVEWDSLCAERTEQLCAGATGEGNCMAANGTPGCDNAACAGLVCAASPWCCETEWDASCAATAADLCGHAQCPSDGECLSSHGTPGCNDEACCNTVCLQDSVCCTDGWDSFCVEEAAGACGACPGEGLCDQPNATPGCGDITCCETVCAEYPVCCQVQWGATCAKAARRLCGNPACPSDGDCSTSHGTPGCDDEACCNTVCLQDWECCAFGWDSFCVEEAAVACGVPNDLPNDAIPLSCCETYNGSTTQATHDTEVPLCAGGGDPAPGVWYRVTGTGGDIAIDTCNPSTAYDTQISVYGGACPRDLSCVVNDDDACDSQSEAGWESQAGERYLVLVHGANGQSGDFDLRICCRCGCGGDFDGDGDMDMADVAQFLNCFTGPDRAAPIDKCDCADFNRDGRIDRDDYILFLCAFGKPG